MSDCDVLSDLFSVACSITDHGSLIKNLQTLNNNLHSLSAETILSSYNQGYICLHRLYAAIEISDKMVQDLCFSITDAILNKIPLSSFLSIDMDKILELLAKESTSTAQLKRFLVSKICAAYQQSQDWAIPNAQRLLNIFTELLSDDDIAHTVVEALSGLGENKVVFGCLCHGPCHETLLGMLEEKTTATTFRVYDLLVNLANYRESYLRRLSGDTCLLSLLPGYLSTTSGKTTDPLAQLTALDTLTGLVGRRWCRDWLRDVGVFAAADAALGRRKADFAAADPFGHLLRPGLLRLLGFAAAAADDPAAEVLRPYPQFARQLEATMFCDDSASATTAVVAVEVFATIATGLAGKRALLDQALMTSPIERIMPRIGQLCSLADLDLRCRVISVVGSIIYLAPGDETPETAQLSSRLFAALGAGASAPATSDIAVLRHLRRRLVAEPFAAQRRALLDVIGALAAMSWGRRLIADCDDLPDLLLQRPCFDATADSDVADAVYDVVGVLVAGGNADGAFSAAWFTRARQFRATGRFAPGVAAPPAEHRIALDEGQ